MFLLAEAADALMTAGGTGGIVALVLVMDRSGLLSKKNGKPGDSGSRKSDTLARQEGERIGAEKAWKREMGKFMENTSESSAKSLAVLERIEAGMEKLNDHLERR